MFRFGLYELLLVAVVAVLLVRPRDWPKLVYKLGRAYGLWMNWWEQVKIDFYSMAHSERRVEFESTQKKKEQTSSKSGTEERGSP